MLTQNKRRASDSPWLFRVMSVVSFSVLSLMLSVAVSRAAEPAPYPLSECVVSGEKLGTMGKPFVHQHEGREVQFCCKSCLKDFNKNPKQFLKKLDDAASKKK